MDEETGMHTRWPRVGDDLRTLVLPVGIVIVMLVLSLALGPRQPLA